MREHLIGGFTVYNASVKEQSNVHEQEVPRKAYETLYCL
jgi:hypothetical protein